MYIEILVCYDIGDDKRRRKFVKELKDVGLQNIQESVFWGRVLNAEIKAILRIMESLLKKEEDKAFLLYTNLSKQIEKNSFGYSSFEMFEERNYEVI
ncbi:MAG: CRISPR-associated endonuclease Cas2 [Leptospiraceae bacterium]|nr:CRISPR-associated endonuclease Cas2 [Leptospiraceae bacterium]